MSDASAPDYKLTYFDTHGRGLQARLLFEMTETLYEDVRIDRKTQWPALKSQTPWGHLPVLEHGDFTLFDSCAIVQYVAQQVGMWPEDPRDQARSIAIINAVDDVWGMLAGFGAIKNPLKLMWSARGMMKHTFPGVCDRFDGLFARDYLFGDTPSAADLSVFALFSVTRDRGKVLGTGRAIARRKNLAGFVERMGAHPQVERYLKETADKVL